MKSVNQKNTAMVYGKTILAVFTGLFLFIFGTFVTTIGFVNRLSAQVGIGLKADHLTYVILGLCIIGIGVILLTYGCRLYYNIWKDEQQPEEEEWDEKLAEIYIDDDEFECV